MWKSTVFSKGEKKSLGNSPMQTTMLKIKESLKLLPEKCDAICMPLNYVVRVGLTSLKCRGTA